MNFIKFLALTTCMLCVITTNATSLDKTIFSTLEPHKSKIFELSMSKGKTLVTVKQSEEDVKSILTCTFFNGDQTLTQTKVKECSTYFVSSDETLFTVKVVNESKSTIDLKIRQYIVKK